MSIDDNWSYHGWIELPFYLGVEHEETLQVRIAGNREQDLSLRIRNDLNKIQVGSEWEYSRIHGEWYGKPPEEREGQEPEYRWGTIYVAEEETATTVDDLRSRDDIPYAHVEEVQTVVELEAALPNLNVPDSIGIGEYGAMPMVPNPWFMSTKVLPRLNELIGAYRIATLPEMRYGIHPVSEATISYALQKVKAPSGETHKRVGHILDSHSIDDRYEHDVERLGIQGRFEDVLERYDKVDPENTFAIVYSLYHLRRWAEALVVASAVLDALLEEAVYELASNEELADVLWEGHGRFYQNVFNQVLPLLGVEKMSEVEGDLWTDLIQARQFRGRLAHGESLNTFDKGDKGNVQDHLRTFYRAVRWLSLQIGRDWALDLKDEGEVMDPFPS